jgi:hypothetical protein
MTAYVHCLDRAVAALDDAISDAQSVAYAAKSRCRSEESAVIETYTRGQNPQVAAMIRARVSSDMSKPVNEVLEYRAVLRRGAIARPAPQPAQ